MLIKRLMSAAAALVMLASVPAFSVFADEEEENNAVPLEVSDPALLTATKEPALSFDGSGFDKYIHLTKDADKAGISFEQDKDTFYQGNSMKVKADTSGVEGFFAVSGMVRDADGNNVFPDAPEGDETDKFSIVGIELHSEDFGLTTFDGCTMQFTYRLTEADQTALQGSAVWVYAATAEDVRMTSTPTQLTVSTALDNNVSQYQSAFLSIAPGQGTSKVIFEMPASSAIKGDVIYLDNITIVLPDDFGDNKYVKNVDGYNPNAEAKATVDELKVKKTQDVGTATEKVEKTSDKTNPVVYVIAVVVGIAVIVGVFFIVKKLRNRYY